MTDYALLDGPPLPQVADTAASLSTDAAKLASCLVSTTCFVGALLLCYVTRLRRDLLLVHLNLAATSVLSQVLVFFGVTATNYEPLCTVSVVLMHASLLCHGACVGIEVWLVYFGLQQMARPRPAPNAKRLLVAAYGCPLLVAAASLIGFYDDYVGSHHGSNCWLPANTTALVLLPPASLLLIVMSVVMGMALSRYFSPRQRLLASRIAMPSHLLPSTWSTTNARGGLVFLFTFAPLAVTTWTLAVCHLLLPRSGALEVLFLICNICQGLCFALNLGVSSKRIHHSRCWSSCRQHAYTPSSMAARHSFGPSASGVSTMSSTTSPPLSKAIAYSSDTFLRRIRQRSGSSVA